MELICTVVPDMDQNIYVYFDENTKDGVIVDPGLYEPKLLEQIAENNINIKGILLTHGHYDHMFGALELKNKFNCDIYSGEKETLVTNDPNVSFTARYDGRKFIADVLLKDEEVIEIGSIKLKVISTPGHTPGGVCFLDEETGVMFTGDTLFRGTFGRTDFPYGDFGQLKTSLLRLFELPEHIQVFAGHMGSSTIGHEKKTNRLFDM